MALGHGLSPGTGKAGCYTAAMMGRLTIYSVAAVLLVLTACAKPEAEPEPAALAHAEEAQTPTVPEGWKTYTSTEHGFSVSYPPEWEAGAGTPPYGVVRFFSDVGLEKNGRPGPECSVIHIYHKVFESLSPAEAARDMKPEDILQPLREQFPDARELDHGITRMAERDAFHMLSVYSASPTEGDDPIVWAVVMFSAYQRGIQYGISCAVPFTDFENTVPLFHSIRRSFQIN